MVKVKRKTTGKKFKISQHVLYFDEPARDYFLDMDWVYLVVCLIRQLYVKLAVAVPCKCRLAIFQLIIVRHVENSLVLLEIAHIEYSIIFAVYYLYIIYNTHSYYKYKQIKTLT